MESLNSTLQQMITRQLADRGLHPSTLANRDLLPSKKHVQPQLKIDPLPIDLRWAWVYIGAELGDRRLPTQGLATSSRSPGIKTYDQWSDELKSTLGKADMSVDKLEKKQWTYLIEAFSLARASHLGAARKQTQDVKDMYLWDYEVDAGLRIVLSSVKAVGLLNASVINDEQTQRASGLPKDVAKGINDREKKVLVFPVNYRSQNHWGLAVYMIDRRLGILWNSLPTVPASEDAVRRNILIFLATNNLLQGDVRWTRGQCPTQRHEYTCGYHTISSARAFVHEGLINPSASLLYKDVGSRDYETKMMEHVNLWAMVYINAMKRTDSLPSTITRSLSNMSLASSSSSVQEVQKGPVQPVHSPSQQQITRIVAQTLSYMPSYTSKDQWKEIVKSELDRSATESECVERLRVKYGQSTSTSHPASTTRSRLPPSTPTAPSSSQAHTPASRRSGHIGQPGRTPQSASSTHQSSTFVPDAVSTVRLHGCSIYHGFQVNEGSFQKVFDSVAQDKNEFWVVLFWGQQTSFSQQDGDTKTLMKKAIHYLMPLVGNMPRYEELLAVVLANRGKEFSVLRRDLESKWAGGRGRRSSRSPFS
ncbi:hypothetical protein F5Y18DRAFT_139543 [Xylariaceae sp. FL1019]|nr:hypothetical protein F5Y18DRAFT_139543 [Xylariaceae sp. FL1019]